MIVESSGYTGISDSGGFDQVFCAGIDSFDLNQQTSRSNYCSTPSVARTQGNKPDMLTTRKISTTGLLLAIVSMVFAVGYLQMIEYLEPCPLCILDRAVVIALGAVFLLALLHNPQQWGNKVYGGLALLLSATGIAICARHIWLQNLPPDKVPDCGAGFWYMLDAMPFTKFLDTILNGSGECADIQWQFLGFTLPEATLGLFVVFALLSLALMFVNTKNT